MNGEWSEEILFPTANAVGYRLIYEAETWLRRISWTALLLSGGPDWAASIDGHLRKSLQKQSASNSARWYLGVDAEEELLWSTTQGQLATVLRLESLQSRLRDLCGMSGEVLADRLRSVGHVRNTLAHNRAISDDTLTVLRGDLTVIRAAVQRFKTSVIYAVKGFETFDFGGAVGDDRIFGAEFDAAQEEMWGRHGLHLFSGTTPDFLYMIRLSHPEVDGWPDAKKLRACLAPVSHLTLCVLANKDADEIQIVVPRGLRLEDKLAVLRKFMTRALLIDAWTDTPPEEQHSSGVSWPRLWFYENRMPE